MSFPRYPAYKPSGVEWLGEVPEHWRIKQLKYCIHRLGSGGTPESGNPDYWADNESDDSIPWVAIGDMSEAPTGEVCLVPEGIPLCMGQRMMNFVCHDDGFTIFLMIYLQSDCLTKYIESTSHGSTVSHLRVPQVENIPVIIPALAEVLAIASHVDKLTAAFNNLMDEASRTISLIQERRSALISAAVTGQIDVRGLVSEAVAA